MPINQISSVKNNSLSFGHGHHVENKNCSPKLKRAVTAASALGVGTAYAIIAKKQGFSLNPSKIFKTPIKDWSLIKLYDKKHPERKLIELEEWEILGLAAGSIAGGLTAGAVVDKKKNFKAKAREAVNQFFGNVCVPVAFVKGAASLYDKYKKPILSKVPQIKGDGKSIKVLNKSLKCIPSAAMTLAALGAGIVSGNRLSNILNEKVFHKKTERHIKKTDFAPHVDDIGMAVSLMADKSKLSTAITNTVPLFLCVPGIQAGLAQEK
ncbi:TPA: hypothetical protein IAC10_14615 [Candidatus Scatousia excrementigallinarum]|uniref:Uncharacterized protein n=1 Tax=Candidatus Scatousia excrementigallinarum TaxID=2840935 RepID=A0A9D1JPQ4_9BACT|nr:hypothetical protein [Candidatus Scatousia excrementigallinarum]